MQTARLPTRKLARLPARRRHASAACEVLCFLNLSIWTQVWLLCDLSGWATFALNHKAYQTLNSLPIPGHALHEKGLQRQISVGTLVSSQERRALAVLVVNRLSTAGQPRVNRGSTAGQPRVNRSFRSSIPGHALHEKGLQRQKGVVPLFGSQEQRALIVPLINR